MDSYSVFRQSRLNMPKSEIVCKPQGFSPNLKAHRKVGFFVLCGINLSPIIKGIEMFYLIREETLNQAKKDYVKGGLGIDYKDSNVTIRHITNDIGKALAFNSEEEANQYLCRGYVVIEEE